MTSNKLLLKNSPVDSDEIRIVDFHTFEKMKINSFLFIYTYGRLFYTKYNGTEIER